MRARVVKRRDAVPLAHEHQRLRAGLRRRRPALGDLAHVERGPVRAAAAPRVAVDHVAEGEDEVAPDVRAGDDEGVAERREENGLVRLARRVPVADDQRERVADHRDEHQRGVDTPVLAGLAVGLVEVDDARDGGEDEAGKPEERRDVRAVVDTQQIEDQRDRERADRHVGEQRVERMAEPGTVQEAAQPFRADDGSADRRVEVGDADAPVPLVEQRPADEAADHRDLPSRSRMMRHSAYVQVAGRDVTVTNRDKIFFPQRGLTKGDLVDHYVSVAPYVLPHVRRRVMQMLRYPNGVDGEFFYQKRVPMPHPEWLETFTILFPSGRTADFPVVNDAAALAWIANLGCIDLHTWSSRIEDVERPDYLLIDLDPRGGDPWAHVRTIALVVKDVMDELGLDSWPKTSGSTGIHILAPIRKVADGTGVFVDFGQNARDRTIASAYSIRPTQDARASAPLRWDEVPDVEAADFTLETMRARIEKVGDLMAGMWEKPKSLIPLFETLKLKAAKP